MPENKLKIINRISLCLFSIVIIDYLFFKGSIKAQLPVSVESIWWYFFIFSVPHVIASHVSYFSKNYLVFYKNKLLIGAAFSLAAMAIFYIMFPGYLYYYIFIYATYHVSWQQMSLCKKYFSNPLTYKIWSWSGVLAILLMALAIGGSKRYYMSEQATTILKGMVISFCILFSILGIKNGKKEEFLLTSIANVLLAITAIMHGYFIVGLIMVRFTHEAAAMMIYIKHDSNLHKKHSSNYIYNFFKIKPEYIFIFLPIFSFLISLIMQLPENRWLISIIIFLSLNHYYLEGVSWKTGALHRKNL